MALMTWRVKKKEPMRGRHVSHGTCKMSRMEEQMALLVAQKVVPCEVLCGRHMDVQLGLKEQNLSPKS